MKIDLPIDFAKFSGAGNDFILIDDRAGRLPPTVLPALAQAVCRRRLSVGADGLIVIARSQQADFKWHFFNADGSVADMCGNGARCAARYARLHGIAPARMRFETGAGIVRAEVMDDLVRIESTPPHSLQLNLALPPAEGRLPLGPVNTGVPHVVVGVEDLETVDVSQTGRSLRYHEYFSPQGTNVNFVQLLDSNLVAIRTYERGVEDETMACGTGATAAALVLHHTHRLPSPVTVRTRSNCLLRIHFRPTSEGFDQVFLEGEARFIYTGRLQAEAWSDLSSSIP